MPETGAALAEYARIARQWALGVEHRALTLGLRHDQLRNAEKAATVGGEVVLPSAASLRLLCLLDIAESLRARSSTRAEQTVWLKAPNSNFDGQAPLERMIEPDVGGLFLVRRYLQAGQGS